MKITEIKRQKRDNNRFSIFIDDRFAFGMERIDIAHYNLSAGMEINNELYDELYVNILIKQAKITAYQYLSYKNRTKKEMINKLKNNYTMDIIEHVLVILEKYEYINDYNYALSFIREKVNLKGYGKIRLKYELNNRGIHDDIINKALNEADINETDLALSLINKKVKGNIDIKQKKRIFDFLVRRGFDYSIIDKAFKVFIQKHV